MFGCRSSKIFWKKPEFLNSRNFCEKVRKKVWVLFKNLRKFQKFQKKYAKFEFLSQKTLFLSQRVRKKFLLILKKVRKV